MNRVNVLPHDRRIDEATNISEAPEAYSSALARRRHWLQPLTLDSSKVLEEADCLFASLMVELLRFDGFLTQLSANLIKAPAALVEVQFEWALRQMVELLGIDRCALALLTANGNHLMVSHCYQVPGTPPYLGEILERQTPWYARCIHQGKIIRLSRLPNDLPTEASCEQEYYRHVGLKSTLTIPLHRGSAVVGGIAFASFHAYRDWSDELIWRLHLVSDMFSNALSLKRADEALRAGEQSLTHSREQLRELASKLLRAQEEERQCIAREMHDDWTQRLALLGIDIARLEKHLSRPEIALALLRKMQAQLVTLSDDVHALSRQLHSSIVDDLGLVEALRSECASLSRREQIAVHYRSQEVPSALPKEVALCVYRVAQEALRNLAKHAAVNEGWVTLIATCSELLLQVQDHGVGFDSAAVRAEPGLGLSSMEERVRLIQGELTVTSALGRGTTVEVRAQLAGRRT